jgi:glyoxylase I family protein
MKKGSPRLKRLQKNRQSPSGDTMIFYTLRRFDLIAALLGAPKSALLQIADETLQTMFKIREIDHVVLRVISLDDMIHFYCNVLGCGIERRQDEIGLVQLRAGTSLVDLVPVDGKLGRVGGAAPGKEGRNMDHFCFRVEPFDEAGIRRHLKKNGVEAEPTMSRYGAEGEGPSIYMTDPEGNVVELKGPPDAKP